MEPNVFRWDDAALLLALVRAGSMAKAAAALGVNTSTVGRRLDALETSLGLRLFDRRTEGVTPSAAAERLLPYAERLEAAAHGLVMEAKGFEQAPEGLVRVSMPPGLADHIIAPRLGALRARFPKLTVELLSSTAYADLERREAELAVRAKRPERGDLVARKIGDLPVGLMASPSLVAQVERLEDLNQVQWLTWNEAMLHIPTGAWVKSVVPEDRICMRSNSVSALVEAARAGLGVMLLNPLFHGVAGLAPLPLHPELQARLPSLPVDTGWLVGHAALREVPRVDAVWRFLLETITELGRPYQGEPFNEPGSEP
ncbi:MAG: LysR family transcriptional regulator [Myxococcota bacterium]